MLEYRPLFETLEFRITVSRVCRSLGFVLQKEEQRKATKQIKELYNNLSGERPTITRSGKYTYWIYPAEFIPVMINVVNEIKKELDLTN